MYCPHCGRKVPENLVERPNFCSYCGKGLQDMLSVEPTDAPPPGKLTNVTLSVANEVVNGLVRPGGPQAGYMAT